MPYCPLKTGFTLNNSIHQILAARYGETDMTIDFDNFVACVMRLEMMFSKFVLCFQSKVFSSIGYGYGNMVSAVTMDNA